MQPSEVNIQPVIMSDVFYQIDAYFKSPKYVREVHSYQWQGRDIKQRPEARMYELLNVGVLFDLEGTNRDSWIDNLRPNLPWADNHFLERVCGMPINPGIEWANWPWGNSASNFLDHGGDRFNHNYMERYWPKYAGQLDTPTRTAEDYESGLNEFDLWGPNKGIRVDYGDLSDIPKQLTRDPQTRQAYLPLFFPEDVGDVPGGRRPCSLGYQFIMRDGHLHCYYPMRSCDFIRHFRDDVYLTLRLMEWVLEECVKLEKSWKNVKPGSLKMHMTSLHMFVNDYNARYNK